MKRTKSKPIKVKVLHIGNIANNAYQNAKMLNQVGYDCDVLSYDYYHIMACPEWDEAEVSGEIGNPNFPAWNKVNLHGYHRPYWFVSGPLNVCIKYLIARRAGRKTEALIYWKCLNWIRNEIASSQNGNQYTLQKIVSIKSKCYVLLMEIYHKIYHLIPCKALQELLKGIWDKLLNYYSKKVTYSTNNKSMEVYSKVIEDFKKLFPDRECRFSESEIYSYIAVAEIMRPLLKQYDIIIGYATNPIFLYLAGVKNYIAYEHGTIRDMPYEDTDIGRLLLLAYARAKTIYVTNLDCYDSAKYIVRNTNIPIVCGLHGLDINRIIKKMDTITVNKAFDPRFGIAKNIPLFFCPSRHDYDENKKSFMKAEDKMLIAAGKLVERFPDFVIILVKWGKDVEAIKKIILEQKLEKNVMWIEPISKEQLYKIYQNVDAVLDQFFWKAYGAITFEVLAVQNCALIASGVRQDYQKKFFGDILPYFACDSIEEIYQAMMSSIIKTDEYKKYTSVSREWVRRHHSNTKIIEKLELAFKFCQQKD